MRLAVTLRERRLASPCRSPVATARLLPAPSGVGPRSSQRCLGLCLAITWLFTSYTPALHERAHGRIRATGNRVGGCPFLIRFAVNRAQIFLFNAAQCLLYGILRVNTFEPH